MYDAVIIGAGMSGLAAGIRLAMFGLQVCILERHTTVGGLNSFYRLSGRDYDVGLHAVTNYRPKGTRQGPLARLLRQLRLSWDDFQLVPQTRSAIAFPGVTLQFSNDAKLLIEEVGVAFPGEVDRFRRLIEGLLPYDAVDSPLARRSSRAVLSETLRDPLLAEMLLCPILFYGGPQEHDIPFGQFSVLFRSIFLEGFARPPRGVRVILKVLTRRFKELGGVLRVRAGVRRIVAAGDEVHHLELDDGREIKARNIISSAGWCETMRLCDGGDVSPIDQTPPGQLSFLESISILDRPPRALGFEHSIVFFNDSHRFHWEKPRTEMVDVHSGVICSPNNFAAPNDHGETHGDPAIRITALANFDRWNALTDTEYQQAKNHWHCQLARSAVRFIPDFRPHMIATDTFTPTTIRKFTGHDNGAVYGAPNKRTDGTTHLKNLFICGTDQGWVGIIGAMISGIIMANRHCLRTIV